MDLYRPIYHFMPEKNWMNDPNGPIYYKGEYHLFYQHNPNDYYWETMHWGHAVSKDLVHWKHLPIALYPSNELGEKHCFSGCAVINDEGVPTIFYTSIGEGPRHQTVGAEQWMAISKDDMLTWEKVQANPVLDLKLHGDMDVKEWRDPFVWKEEDKWYMVLGGSNKGNGAVFIYSSDDLYKWKYLNVLLEMPEYKFLECPNMLKFGDKYVLVHSPSDKVKYQVGTLNEDYTFTTEYEDILDNSGWEGFYAPNTLIDSQGRKVMWGWLTEVARGDFEGGAGWAGAQSVPRILSLKENGKLKMEPAVELQVLRYQEEAYKAVCLNKEGLNLTTSGRSLEIETEIEIKGGEELCIKVLKSENGEEETAVRYDAASGIISVDRSKSSLSDLPHKTNLAAKLPLETGESLKLHIFVDHSIIEVFANDEVCISTRIYPTLESSQGVSFELLKGEEVNIKTLNLWKLKSIWQ